MQCRFWGDVLGRLEHVFGNISLDKNVHILVLYAVYELCLTVYGDYVVFEVVSLCVVIACVDVLWCEFVRGGMLMFPS